MTTLPKWTEDRTATLVAGVNGESPVSKATVARLAEELETTSRSVASKLRKLGHEVETAGVAQRAFTDEEAEQLRTFVEDNDGVYTYAEIAANFANGKFNARQIQGKVLAMELTDAVKPTPRPENTKTYSDEEQALIVKLANEGAFVEDIADAANRSVASVRGKLLSLLRDGSISAIPKQRDVKGQAPDSFEALGDVSKLTVAEIAEKTGKTERGVKTMLTRRQVSAKDYNGAAKAKKAAAAE